MVAQRAVLMEGADQGAPVSTGELEVAGTVDVTFAIR
jgi:uncharacterized protein YggE